MFRATMCPYSGEMRHWYFSLCMGGCLVCWLSLVPSHPYRVKNTSVGTWTVASCAAQGDFVRHYRLFFFKWSQLGAHYFLVYLFQFLYVFWATMCPYSGEIRHWYFSLCMGGCLVCWLGWYSVSSQPADQTATHTEWKIPVSHRYSKFSWWWAHSCMKHVQKLK